jgi:hypothetical protein
LIAPLKLSALVVAQKFLSLLIHGIGNARRDTKIRVKLVLVEFVTQDQHQTTLRPLSGAHNVALQQLFQGQTPGKN